MPINKEQTPPPIIGKAGRYTVFITPPSTPKPFESPKPHFPTKLAVPPSPSPPPPVQPPPQRLEKVRTAENPSAFGFFWDAVAKVQNAHSSLDEYLADWFGLNQSKYQWALDDYYGGKLSCIHHAILIGDERQLPAMVKSKISEKADFRRSMFERLVLLGQIKKLLSVQYRMHPFISLFPNRKFYDKQIIDARNVKDRCYEKHFLPGNMYGSYSFINVAYGKDEFDDRHSRKNMVDVTVDSELVASLYKESIGTKQKVSVGVISPYKTQVFAIQEKLGKTYSSGADSNFS